MKWWLNVCECCDERQDKGETSQDESEAVACTFQWNIQTAEGRYELILGVAQYQVGFLLYAFAQDVRVGQDVLLHLLQGVPVLLVVVVHQATTDVEN